MAYLNCPYCPSQSYPTGREHLWLTGLKVAVPLIEYKCLSGHVHYVITEYKEVSDANSVHGRSGTCV
jgi:hypothetical protein